MIKIIFKKYIKIIIFKTTPKDVLNEKPKIKKIYIYYFGSFMLILYIPSAKQNVKMSFLFNKCYSYISLKKAKTNKVEPTIK
jgi:hypothetical protein